MRTEIRDLQQSLGFSMVYVTHDQAEAITMADQVVLMKNGRVQQSGTPREIYEKPASAFVAGFIGTPPMNLVNGSDLIAAEADFTVGIRPEHVRLSNTSGIKALVHHVEYLGADVLLDCRLGRSNIQARIEGQASVQAGTEIWLDWLPEHMHFFDSKNGVRLTGIPAGFSIPSTA